MHEAKKSRRLAIVLSVLVIVCCVSLIIGSTFAMFSANKQFPINVSGGKIDIDATLTLNNAFSVSGDDEGDRTEYTQRGEDGSITIGTGNPGDSGYFGKVSVSADENEEDNIVSSVSMEGLARGAGAQFTLSVTNNSTVGMKFIAYLEKGNGDFAAALDVTPIGAADGAAYTESGTRVIFTRGENEGTWQGGGKNGAKTDFSFEVYLPWANTDTLSGGLETMNIVIEAVQSNADTDITVEMDGSSQSCTTFEEALEAANNAESATATVKAGDGTHNIPDGFIANKPLTIEGNGDGTVINGDIKTNDDLTLKNSTYNGNITSNGGSVNVENATINGGINYTGTAGASAGTFSALAKVSRAYAPAANAATITLTNATVVVENAATAISVNGANLVLENSTVTFNTSINLTTNVISITNGTIYALNSSITATKMQGGQSSEITALQIDNTAASGLGSAVSRIENTPITVYAAPVVNSYYSYGIKAAAADIEAVNTDIQAHVGIGVYQGTDLTVSGGSIEADVFAISGNNQEGNAYITVTNGANLSVSAESCAIYMPSQGELQILNGSIVTGYTAIEARLGWIVVRDATLVSTATYNYNTSGHPAIDTLDLAANPDGSVIHLDTHSYTSASAEGNRLELYLNEGAKLIAQNEGIRLISVYDWDQFDDQQIFIVDSHTNADADDYPLVGLAANEDALERLANEGSYAYKELILLNDITTSDGVRFARQNAPLVFNLNGKTIKGTNAGVTIENAAGSILTITGNGTVYSTNIGAQGRHVIANYGTLTIENGTFGSDKSRGNAVRNYGTATINGGNFTACDNYVNDGYAYAIVNGNGTMTIHDARVYGHMNGAIAADGGTLTVNGGTYELTEEGTATKLFYMVYTSGSGQVVINDGTFIRDVANDFGFFYQENPTGKITVNGGAFDDLRRDYINIAGAGQVEINGGSFVEVPKVTSNDVFVTFGKDFSLEGETVTDPTLMSIQAYLNAKADLVFTDPIEIPKEQSFTIDANGSTLTGTIINRGTLTITGKGTITNAADDKNHTITNYGTLTIGEKGVADDESITVDNLTHGTAAVHNDVGATFTLNSGKLLRTKEAGADEDNSGGNSFYNLRNYGKVIINGGTIEQTGHFSSLVENGWNDGTQNTQQAEAVMIINGGTFSGGINTIKNDDWGILTIHGGIFTNIAQACVLNWNVATIDGGTYKILATKGTPAVILNGHINETMDKGVLSVKHITYSGAPLIEWMTGSGSIDAGTVTVYDAATLQAVADVAADKTIILGADITIGMENSTATGINFVETATLDFNGYTVSYAGTAFAVIVDGATVTFMDSSESGNGGVEGGEGGNNVALTVTNQGVANILGGVYNVGPDVNEQGNSTIYILSPGGTVNISGGRFSTEATYNNRYYVLNMQNSATGDFNVSGGEFVGYNPADGDDVQGGNYVSDDYTVETTTDDEGNTIYTVVPAPAEGTEEAAA